MTQYFPDFMKVNLASCLGFTDNASGFSDDFRQTPNGNADVDRSDGSDGSSEDSVNSSDDADPLELKSDDVIRPAIKLELRNAIQSRRISRGERELTVTFDPPKRFPTNQRHHEEIWRIENSTKQKRMSQSPEKPLTQDEERKNQRRRERNKRSADKSREKRKQYTHNLEKEKQSLEEEHNNLKTELEALKKLKFTLESTYKLHLQRCSKTTITSKYQNVLPEFSRLPPTATSSTAIGGQSTQGGQSVGTSRSVNSSGSHQNNLTIQNQQTKSWLDCFSQHPLVPLASTHTNASIPVAMPTQSNNQQIPQNEQLLIPTVVKNEESSSAVTTISSTFTDKHHIQIPIEYSSQQLTRYQNLERTPFIASIQTQVGHYPIDSSTCDRILQADPMFGQSNLLQALSSSVCEDVSESQEISEWKDGVSESGDGSLMAPYIAGIV